MNSIKTISLVLLQLLSGQILAQVIYERTYPDGFPELKTAMELSDLSTVSFANNTPCFFAGWRHISPEGEIVQEGWLANESTHSLRTRQIGKDSILVSCRVGPLDFNGPNFFKIALWTPDSLRTLVLDTIPYSYWDLYEGGDMPIRYEAFLYKDDHVLYQRGDTLFARNTVTGHNDFRKTFFHITHVYPVKDGLMVFSAGLPPTFFNYEISLVKTWLNLSAHPLSFNSMVAMDSFMVGINFLKPDEIYVVNAFNEAARGINLSSYFSQIDTLTVYGDTLLVIGRNGTITTTLQLNASFQILKEKPYALPDNQYAWKLSFYPERIYAWRKDGLAGYHADYRVAYSYLEPQPITYVDLAFIDISVDSQFSWSPDPGSPDILVLAASVLNQSTDTLHSLTIHYQDDPVQFCDPGIYPVHITDLETAPGDTAIVMLYVISWDDPAIIPFVQQFYVQHGNHHLDSLTTNNVFELIYLISHTEESDAVALSVFPNPFIDFLQVSEPSDVVLLNMYDQTGRMVSSGHGRLDNLGGLPVGAYVLQIMDGNSLRVQRVVKVE